VRLFRFAHSTNVERVALALAHKGLEVESVWVDPADRTPVREVSGQELVPVLVDDEGTVRVESMDIVRWLDEGWPDPPLYRRDDPAREAELLIFVEWFNRVWKWPPNAIAAELERAEPDQALIEELGAHMLRWLDLFEALLAGRDYLFGDTFSAADVAAFPFLKYAGSGLPEGDDELFHRVLVDQMPLGNGHPRLADWVRRVDERPRA
jgi:glutathione S-transferase